MANWASTRRHNSLIASIQILACRSTPMQVGDPNVAGAPLTGVVAIAAGGSLLTTTQTGGVRPQLNGYSLALKSDGTVWAWGDNDFGQLGVNPVPNPSCQTGVLRVSSPCFFAPQLVGGASGVKAISAGLTHAMALASDGTVWAWGAIALAKWAMAAPPLSPFVLKSVLR
jgi:alpha-tubulin suppressor-like RCC1 family protein